MPMQSKATGNGWVTWCSLNPSIAKVLPSTEAIVVDASQPKTKVTDFFKDKFGGPKGFGREGDTIYIYTPFEMFFSSW